MLPLKEFKGQVHRQDITRCDVLLLAIAGLGGGPVPIKEARDYLKLGGYSIPKKWNLSEILSSSKGRAIKVPEGWELTMLGYNSLRDLGVDILDKSENLEQQDDSSLTNHVGIHPKILFKCNPLFSHGNYVEAVEKSFKVVRDRLRFLTGYETGSEAFGKGKLYIRGAAASHVDFDFNEGVKFLTMAIDKFRNEKSHTSDGNIDDPVRAQQYLMLSSLAMYLLDGAEIKK